MPATHWTGRITIMVITAALIAGFAFSGAAVGAFRWSAHCGGETIRSLWAPLLDDKDAAPPDPAAACFHSEPSPAAD
jgi:hypothetical protein